MGIIVIVAGGEAIMGLIKQARLDFSFLFCFIHSTMERWLE